jgi:hypothetical protein
MHRQTQTGSTARETTAQDAIAQHMSHGMKCAACIGAQFGPGGASASPGTPNHGPGTTVTSTVPGGALQALGRQARQLLSACFLGPNGPEQVAAATPAPGPRQSSSKPHAPAANKRVTQFRKSVSRASRITRRCRAVDRAARDRTLCAWLLTWQLAHTRRVLVELRLGCRAGLIEPQH